MKNFIFRGILVICFSVYLTACVDFARDNPLDPKNPKSESQKITLVEAFVNDDTPFSPFALSAIDELDSQSESEVVFLEYHLPAQSFQDEHAIAAAKVRYDFYETQNRAVPDVFFNGLNQRVQGADSKATALERFQIAYAQEREAISFLTIEAQFQFTGNSLTIEVTIARLGEERLSNFFVQAVAFEDLGISGKHHVVRHVWQAESFSNMSSGEVKNLALRATILGNSNPQDWQIIVFVQKNENKEILQTILVE